MTISFKLTAEVSATVTQAPTPVLACWQFRVRKKPVEKNKLDGNMKRQKFLNHRRQVDGALTNKALLEHAHLHWGAKWDIKVGCNDLPRFLRYFVFILSMQWKISQK